MIVKLLLILSILAPDPQTVVGSNVLDADSPQRSQILRQKKFLHHPYNERAKPRVETIDHQAYHSLSSYILTSIIFYKLITAIKNSSLFKNSQFLTYCQDCRVHETFGTCTPEIGKTIATIQREFGINDCKTLQKYLANISDLSLVGQSLIDLNPLFEFKNLTKLQLTSNAIKDLSPLRNLVRVTHLQLEDNEISNINPLKHLKKIVYLDLSNNCISSMKVIENFSKLLRLDLNDNCIKNCSSLMYLKQLEQLNMQKNRLEDIKSLACLIHLKDLDISVNKIKNIDSLKKLKKLISLNVQNNHIKDFNAIKHLKPSNVKGVEQQRHHQVNLNVLLRLPTQEELESDQIKCLICLDTFSDDEELTEILCSHVFHKKCAMHWFLSTTSCPICRQEIHFKTHETNSADLSSQEH